MKYFPKHLHPKKESGWLETIHRLNSIDNIPFEKITELVKKTREDDFWAKNFLSLPKLRKKNGEGLSYAVVFNEALKNKNNGKNQSNNSKSQGATDEQITNIWGKKLASHQKSN